MEMYIFKLKNVIFHYTAYIATMITSSEMKYETRNAKKNEDNFMDIAPLKT